MRRSRVRASRRPPMFSSVLVSVLPGFCPSKSTVSASSFLAGRRMGIALQHRTDRWPEMAITVKSSIPVAINHPSDGRMAQRLETHVARRNAGSLQRTPEGMRHARRSFRSWLAPVRIRPVARHCGQMRCGTRASGRVYMRTHPPVRLMEAHHYRRMPPKC
jgi:hypothetical protein